jgi:methylthioribulose-1-phosphate dehydratase
MDAAPSGSTAGDLIPQWAADAIIGAGRRMDALRLVPATAGNISVRLDADRLAITRSGGHKGFLTLENLMVVDLHGVPRSEGKPSAETGLHCQLYRKLPQVGAVLHGHSVAGTVLSMQADTSIRFTGYEVVKAFAGQTTHDVSVDLPVFDNDQDIPRLAAQIESYIPARTPLGYYIRGHGAYIWATDMQRALTHMEALEFLLACELERRKL